LFLAKQLCLVISIQELLDCAPVQLCVVRFRWHWSWANFRLKSTFIVILSLVVFRFQKLILSIFVPSLCSFHNVESLLLISTESR
jgi:hypothetical protein